MEIAILRTDISTGKEFNTVRNRLKRFFSIRECTIDLDDVDKVVRVIGNEIETDDVIKRIKSLGFFCEELQ